MNVKDFDIVTDYFGVKALAPEGSSTIAIVYGLECSECAVKPEFQPLVANGDAWLCLQCWDESSDDVMSERTKERLEEAAVTTKTNYLIRNM